MGLRVLFARFCRGGWEHHGLGSWLASSFLEAEKDARISYFNSVVVDKCPTDAARNESFQLAIDRKIDALFMVDHDNVPHKDFFAAGIDFVSRNPAGVLAAPYCGARPCEPGYPDREVQVVVKDETASEGRRRITRSEAATLTGIQPAYGVGTLLAVGMKCVELIQPPWFNYRYFDPHHAAVGTEDFAFSEKLVDAVGTVAVHWGCWAGHFKSEMIGAPEGGGA